MKQIDLLHCAKKVVYDFVNNHLLLPNNFKVKFEEEYNLAIDAAGGGAIIAKPKYFYFTQRRRLKNPCEAVLMKGDTVLCRVGFWYSTTKKLIEDFLYQLHWHSILANEIREYSLGTQSQELVKWFENNLSKKTSYQKAEEYISFLYENGYNDIANTTSEDLEDREEILEMLFMITEELGL